MQMTSTEPISMLVIEPSAALATTLQAWLTRDFHSTLDLGMARSLGEGMAYLSARRTDLVLLNRSLPDANGLDAVRAVRTAFPATAVVVLCGVAGETPLLQTIGAGAHEALCVSTLSAPALRAAIDRALARARSQSGSAPAPGAAAQPAPSSVHRRIVHDLNNAITSINGFADLLVTRLDPGDPARASAEQIRAAGLRAAGLVRSLTDGAAEHSPASVTVTDPARVT